MNPPARPKRRRPYNRPSDPACDHNPSRKYPGAPLFHAIDSDGRIHALRRSSRASHGRGNPLALAGFLNAGHFEAALTSVQRHPLLYATVKKRRFGTPNGGITMKHRQLCNGTDARRPTASPPSLHGPQPGISHPFQVVNREDGHDLLFKSHHACTDAQGLTR